MDDFFKNLKRLNEELEGLIPDWMFEYAKCADTIVKILPDDIPDALTIISVAIDHYAKNHHIRSSVIWKALFEVSTAVHKEVGDDI